MLVLLFVSLLSFHKLLERYPPPALFIIRSYSGIGGIEDNVEYRDDLGRLLVGYGLLLLVM